MPTPPAYDLTLARAEAYSLMFDFRTPIVKAARQILTNYGIDAVGPGEGTQKVPRYFTSIDFVRGAATGRKGPVKLGDRRYMEYCEFFGTLAIFNTVPMETDEKTKTQYLSEDHARELDRLTSLEDAIFMEHVDALSPLLSLHEITSLMPIEPDERPENEREVNMAFRRWRAKVNIRYEAWPAT